MTIEYRKYRADPNFEVDFGVKGAIGAIVTKWDLILFGLWIVSIHNIIVLRYASYAFKVPVNYCTVSGN